MEPLKKILEENEIKYVFLGDYLGGFVREGYEKYMEAQNFRDGVKEILNVAGGRLPR